MENETNTKITLPTYQKHWVHTKEYGHDIVIWSDTGKLTIKCIWPDKRREADGRVHLKMSPSLKKRIDKLYNQDPERFRELIGAPKRRTKKSKGQAG